MISTGSSTTSRWIYRSGPTDPNPTAVLWSDPKCREIFAPAFQDRLVHHLVVDRLLPLINKKLIFDSFANRPGKGTHSAALRLQQFMRSLPPTAFVIKCDLSAYFTTINRPKLLELVLFHPNQLPEISGGERLFLTHIITTRFLRLDYRQLNGITKTDIELIELARMREMAQLSYALDVEGHQKKGRAEVREEGLAEGIAKGKAEVLYTILELKGLDSGLHRDEFVSSYQNLGAEKLEQTITLAKKATTQEEVLALLKK